MYEKPLVVHKSKNIYLLEDLDDGQLSEKLAEFTDIIKIPEGVHTFQLSAYALWSAAAKEIDADYIIKILNDNSSNYITDTIKQYISKKVVEFGLLELFVESDCLVLKAKNSILIDRIMKDNNIKKLDPKQIDNETLYFHQDFKLPLKRALFKLELFTVDHTEDYGGSLELKVLCKIRDYQLQAIQEYCTHKDKAGGGVIIMPPGSGKTIVGLGIIERLGKTTLILTEDDASARRWINEISEKTSLPNQKCFLYKNTDENLKPLTISTYTFITSNQFAFDKLASHEWGLIIYDDCHKLMADKTSECINFLSKYKLALASTLARSDKNGSLIFSLIGPKYFEIAPRSLEQKGHLSPVKCFEVQVPLPEYEREAYDKENGNERFRIATFNSNKQEAIMTLLIKFWAGKVLIVSYRLQMAIEYGEKFNIPVINRMMKFEKRQLLTEQFSKGDIVRLITTQVGEKLLIKNLDLLIAASYHQGSEREEYLRLGKLLYNSTEEKGFYYSLVSTDTIEEDYYRKRRKYLVKHGYRFYFLTLEALLKGDMG